MIVVDLIVAMFEKSPIWMTFEGRATGGIVAALFVSWMTVPGT
jgi:hypothetical protein